MRGDLDERYDMKVWRSVWRTGDGWRKAEEKDTMSEGMVASVWSGSIVKKRGKLTAG